MNLHRFAKSNEHGDGRLGFAAFDIIDVFAGHIGFGSEPLLR